MTVADDVLMAQNEKWKNNAITFFFHFVYNSEHTLFSMKIAGLKPEEKRCNTHPRYVVNRDSNQNNLVFSSTNSLNEDH